MALFCHHHPRPKHHHLFYFYHFLTTFTTFTFLFFSSTSAFTTLTPQPSAQAVNKQPLQRDHNKNGNHGIVVVADEKRFGRPGSWPPSCRSKCGWCNPCQPVHVPVQLGFIIRLEYYPEAWRCKCGNKFFMP